MEGIIFDLKNFRMKQLNGMSQQEFANQIGISQDKVSRMENDPSQVSVEILLRIAAHFGMSLDELIKVPKPKIPAMRVDYTWSSAEFIRRTLLEYIHRNPVSENHRQTVEYLEKVVKTELRKPKVAFIGRSDVGKSTMINSLLGSSRMPAHWTPTTSIAVYIKHINDRPAYMDDDVWIFQSDPDTKETWDDTRLEDQDYCRKLKLSSGNYDLLNSYGTRGGEHFKENQATAAVAFIDSSLLLNCDIVDLPGYGTGDRMEDDTLSLREKNKADVLVYLSIANGFMRSEDIAYIREAIPALPEYNDPQIPPLGNLFIVASQAHVIEGGEQELDTILRYGCERFQKSLTDDFWNGRKKPDKLLERFYCYTSNKATLRRRFEQDFRALIQALPQVIERRARDMIAAGVADKDEELKQTVAEYQGLLDDRHKYEEALKAYTRSEPQQYAALQTARQKVTEAIAKYRCESREALENYYRDTITVDHLAALMEQRDVKKKKDDLQIFGTYVSGLLEDRMNAVLTQKAEKLSADIDEFLNDFTANMTITIDRDSFHTASFDARRIFMAGLAGVMTYGALSLWAVSCGNLGAYILVAKGVSLLSALGISVGGTAAAASAVAAIGGPVVLGAALALIAAISVFAMLSGGWRKSIAKKIVDVFEKANVKEQLQAAIDAYWIDTQNAFDQSANHLAEEWNAHIGELRELIQMYDVDAIMKAKEEVEQMRNFLQNIPY